jgi:DNA-binding MarR family transcriptional regulator
MCGLLEFTEISVEHISLSNCNCFQTRKAARRLTQIYDAILAPSGIRSTQYMIMAVLHERGGLSVNDLASLMLIERTAMGKNLKPLERDALIAVNVSDADRRSRTITLTKKGSKLLEQAYPLWRTAQSRFEKKHGKQFAEDLRGMLHAVAED